MANFVSLFSSDYPASEVGKVGDGEEDTFPMSGLEVHWNPVLTRTVL